MSKVIANVRNLRKRGKTKLVRISDQVNSLAWELTEKNEKVNDAHTAKAIAMLDESLALMQRSLGLLNSIKIDPSLVEEAKKPAKASAFSKKAKAEIVEETAANDAEEDAASNTAPIASLKPKG